MTINNGYGEEFNIIQSSYEEKFRMRNNSSIHNLHTKIDGGKFNANSKNQPCKR